MDESAQQAVQLGVNLVIFIVALTLGINLMIGVRDVADVAADYDASIPTGSRVVSIEETGKRIVKGSEILSYYANYMNEVNHARTGNFHIIIEDSTGEGKLTGDTDLEDKNIKEYCKSKGIDFSNDFEVIVSGYDKENEITMITLKEIE